MFKLFRKIGCLGMTLVCTAIGLGGIVVLGVLDVRDPGSTAPVGAVSDIPARMMSAYVRAAAGMAQLDPQCKGMTWSLLAGIGKVESGHAQGHTVDTTTGDITPPIIGLILDGSGSGGNTTPVMDTDQGRWDGNSHYDAAVGPMQFLPSTFAAYAAKVHPEDGGAGANPNNSDDETMAAALYLCDGGKDLTDSAVLRKSILRYNNSGAYADEVLRWAQQYAALGDTVPTGGGQGSDKVQTVIAAARSQFGQPYSWGGGDASGPTTGACCSNGGQDGRTVKGLDCSGLMTYVFAKVGINLPRLAADQAGVGQRIPASAGVGALQPGDMVFFGNASEGIYHVGLYIGGGQMINAPKPGDVVKQAAVWSYDYAGGARPIS
ncbi:C40 family peptidase [Kitasatospora sp. NBC_01300]|uniref:C40 family peptidase n=1 Tax=Kitasatospora sp. NBC_01300 TaxID=2903574 RepID=UPI002F90E195|nr:NlpC/P60 family protein [Kitasatospora sp. NBC_01300]